MTSRPLARRVTAIVATAVLGALIAGLSVGSSQASWVDREWDTADARALDCSLPAVGTSTASATLLGGTLLGLDLGTLAQVRGIEVANPGTGAVAAPASSTPVAGSGGTAYQNPLEVSAAFGAITAQLGGVLQLPLATDVGVYGQYARAGGDASSASAAGAITQGGAIDLAVLAAPPEERPGFGWLRLGTVLEQVLGASLASLVSDDLADLRLDIGAIGSAAGIEGCAAAWGGSVHDALRRDYLIAGLGLDVDTPLVDGLTTSVVSTLGSLQSALTALSGNAGLLNALSGAVLGPSGIGGLLAGLGVGTPSVSLVVTPDFSAVTALLDDTISDDDGIVAIDLGRGGIDVDLAALLGAAYGHSDLNGLPPNAELLIDDAVLGTLLLAVGDAIDDWIDDVRSAIQAALAVVRVQFALGVPLNLLGNTLGTLTIRTDASLASLLAGTATVSSSFSQTAGLCSIIIVGPTLCGAVSTLLTSLTPAVLGALGPLIGGTLQPVLNAAVEPILTTLGSTLAGLAARVVTLLRATLGGLFGSAGLVGLLANAQNDPDPAVAAGPEPAAWAALPTPTTGPPYATGRFDVAALRLSVLGAVPGVEVELARSSVGPNVVTG